MQSFEELDDTVGVFQYNALHVTRDDEVGWLAKSDPINLMVGEWLCSKTKRRFDQRQNVVESVRMAIRRLSHLYLHFRKSKSKTSTVSPYYQGRTVDLFFRENMYILRYGEEGYTDQNLEEHNSGLKFQLFHLIEDSAEKVLDISYLKCGMILSKA